MVLKQVVLNVKIPLPMSDEEYEEQVNSKAFALCNEFYKMQGSEMPTDRWHDEYWQKKAKEQTEKTKYVYQLMTPDGIQPNNGTLVKFLWLIKGADFDKVEYISRTIKEIKINVDNALYYATQEKTKDGKITKDFIISFHYGHEQTFHNIEWDEDEQCYLFDYATIKKVDEDY